MKSLTVSIVSLSVFRVEYVGETQVFTIGLIPFLLKREDNF